MKNINIFKNSSGFFIFKLTCLIFKFIKNTYSCAPQNTSVWIDKKKEKKNVATLRQSSDIKTEPMIKKDIDKKLEN